MISVSLIRLLSFEQAETYSLLSLAIGTKVRAHVRLPAILLETEANALTIGADLFGKQGAHVSIAEVIGYDTTFSTLGRSEMDQRFRRAYGNSTEGCVVLRGTGYSSKTVQRAHAPTAEADAQGPVTQKPCRWGLPAKSTDSY